MSNLRQSKSAKKAQKKPSIDEQLHKQWQKIHKLKQKTQSFSDELRTFEQEAAAELGAHETAMVEAVIHKITKLAPFFRRKTLVGWKQEELIDLIGHDLGCLQLSPYCDDDRYRKLKCYVNEILGEVYGFDLNENGDLIDPVEAQEEPELDTSWSEDSDEEDAYTAPEEHHIEDMFEELFEDFQHVKNDKQYTSQDTYDDWREQMEEEWREAEQADDPRYAIEQLFDKASLKTWFRKLSRILHPDREQDPDKKAAKHEQMIQLTEARDSHDVFTLLSLYQEHTGESPLENLECDKPELLRQLKRYAQWVRDTREDIVAEQPPHVQVYYAAIYDENIAKRKRNYADYKRTMDQAIEHQHHIARYTTSIPKLTEHLQELYDERMAEQDAMLQAMTMSVG